MHLFYIKDFSIWKFMSYEWFLLTILEVYPAVAAGFPLELYCVNKRVWKIWYNNLYKVKGAKCFLKQLYESSVLQFACVYIDLWTTLEWMRNGKLASYFSLENYFKRN